MPAETAKIVRFHSVGGPEVLKIENEPMPEPGKGEVRLNVQASHFTHVVDVEVFDVGAGAVRVVRNSKTWSCNWWNLCVC